MREKGRAAQESQIMMGRGKVASESTSLLDLHPLAPSEKSISSRSLVENTQNSASSSSSAGHGHQFTVQLLGATLAAVVGASAQFGYATAMLNNIRPAIISDFQANTSCNADYDVERLAASSTKFSFDLATAMLCVGGLIGSLLGGWLAERIGRKHALLANNIIAIASGLILAFANGFPMLFGGRLAQGIAAGQAMVVVSTYLGEIAPTTVRGTVGTMNQLMIAVSLFVATALGLPYLLGTCQHWHIVVGGPLALALLQVLTLPFFPRSPKFLLIQRGDLAAAGEELRKLRGRNANIDSELGELQLEKNKMEHLPKMSVFQVLFDRHLRFRFLLTAILHMSQQLTGINGVFYYSRAIYTKAGLSHVALIALVPAIVNIIFVGVSVRAVERLGRRKLMLLGLGGMGASHVILTCGFCFEEGFFSGKAGANWTSALTIAGSLGVVTFFSLGPGPIPFMIVNELFPQQARAVAYSFAGVINWTANYLIGQFFLVILEELKPYGFLLFAMVSFLLAAAVYAFLPETKAKEIDQIDSFFRRRALSAGSIQLCCITPGRESID